MTDGLWTLLAALGSPFVDPSQRLFVPSLLLGAVVGALWLRTRPSATTRSVWRTVLQPHAWSTPSSRLDLQLFLFRQMTRLIGLLPTFGGGTWLAFSVASSLDHRLGEPPLPDVPTAAVVLVYTIILFVVWDFSRYVVHRLMHAVPAFWAFHQVHHSAEILTPLTFYRVHPLEGVVYALRGATVTGGTAGVFFWMFGPSAEQHTLLGVNAIGLVLTMVLGNLRHSEVWMSFGPRWERWLISPAQHQLHHASTAEHHRANYGTWLAIWDRLGGTLALSPPTPEGLRVGLDPQHLNHDPTDLVSAVTRPIIEVTGLTRAAFLLVGIPLISGPSHAQEAPAEPTDNTETTDTEDAPQTDGASTSRDDVDTEPDAAQAVTSDEDGDYEVVVEDDGIDLRIAGSAHAIDQEELERFEYDDIHRVLSKVPGVYLRDEDGFGLRPNIGIRGANSDRSAKITLLEDGVLLGPAPYAAPAAYYFPMSTRMTGIEVYKGPAAIQHGPHTVGGAIDMRTRDVPSAPDAQLDLAAGLRSAFKIHGWGGAGGPRWGVLLEGVHLVHGGFKTLDDGGPTGFDKSEFMLKAAVRTDPERTTRHEVQVKAGYAREESHETYLGLTDEDFAATPYRRYAASGLGLMRWRRTQAELRWRMDIGQQIDLTVTAYHHWMTRAWTKLNAFSNGPDLHALLANPTSGQAEVFAAILRGEEDTTDPGQQLLIGTNDRRFHAGGVAAVARHRHNTPAVAYQGEWGIRLHADEIRRIHTEDPYSMTAGELVMVPDASTETTLENHGRALALAMHTRHDIVTGPVRLLPGVRVEVIRTAMTNTTTGTQTQAWRAIPLPGLGIHVQPRDWLGVFGGVYRGFSPVAPGQDPSTLPESSWNAEAGARFQWRRFHGEVVGFFNPYRNLTGQCTFSGGCSDTQIDQQYNGGEVFIYGVELGMDQGIAIAPSWSLDIGGNYSFTRSSFQTGFASPFPQFGTVEIGDSLPYVPEHQGSARVTLKHPIGSLGLALQTRGAMRDIAGQGPIPDEERIGAMATLDVAADFRISRHVTLYTTVQNVTNATYAVSRRPFGLRPGMPIQAMFGVKVQPAAPGRDRSASK